MNYQQARIFCITFTIIAALLCLNGIISCFRTSDNYDTYIELKEEQTTNNLNVTNGLLKPKYVKLKINPRVQSLSRQFADLNDEHLFFANSIGIKPICSLSDILLINKPLIEVLSCENFHVDKLRYSYPFLVDEAADLLNIIGSRFNKKLADQNGGNYKIKVTSLLRTNESINRLKRGNVNSTKNSAHLYGTTFDIGYTKFYEAPTNLIKHTDGDLKNLLAEVLLELHDEGKCLVKYEVKQGCFHITATGR